jgi:hypothetical protein
MFEILFAINDDRKFALRLTFQSVNSAVEFLRSCGFTRDAARIMVKGIKHRMKFQVPESRDAIYLSAIC